VRLDPPCNAETAAGEIIGATMPAGDWSTPLPCRHAPLPAWRCPANSFLPIVV
jgi:hypothetical protein